MSEYQYYEFLAIEQLLNDEIRREIASLSSRSQVSSRKALFVYNYGDFPGDSEQLMTEHFDMMLYMTSWGNRRLIIRLPSSLIDATQVAPFCISEEIDHWYSEDKRYFILDLNFQDEEQYGWADGEGWLDNLVDLREELIQGDFRVLYLAWLKAEKLDEQLLEPPVPNGLKQLSNAQKTYCKFVDIDKAMLAAGALQSEKQTSHNIDIEKWITNLSEKEKHGFLSRLSLGEKNLSIQLNKRLSELATKNQPSLRTETVKRRPISTLNKLAAQWLQQKKEEERKKAQLANQKKLNLLAAQKKLLWEDVYRLIDQKKSKSYDLALGVLTDLHELAQYQGKLEDFKQQLDKIQSVYSNRSALISKLKNSGLIKK